VLPAQVQAIGNYIRASAPDPTGARNVYTSKHVAAAAAAAAAVFAAGARASGRAWAARDGEWRALWRVRRRARWRVGRGGEVYKGSYNERPADQAGLGVGRVVRPGSGGIRVA
jgi:hypothetical protein